MCTILLLIIPRAFETRLWNNLSMISKFCTREKTLYGTLSDPRTLSDPEINYIGKNP